ncbi:hypothetical protein [Agromyces archimandritae]|uniref:Uncharacterized protein n=1 Tax=Agromyces archimandritae TaxID=2781962 RepID=A0A975IPT1_9MICO|nr:hypothetical protein [Agromyces archimandritae]QTX05932.1 hypothetical protein G127AT_07000 [Agromyces archimandritae]
MSGGVTASAPDGAAGARASTPDPVSARRHANASAPDPAGPTAAVVRLAPRCELPRAERFVMAWCRWYTADLPGPVATERRAELASDLHEHRVDAGASAGRAIVGRALHGMPADLAWRLRTLRRESAEPGTLPIAMPAATHLVTALLLAWGVTVIVHALRAAGATGASAASEMLGAGIVGFALASIGAILTLAPGRRTLGAFALASAAYILLRHGMYAVFAASTTMTDFYVSQPAQAILVNRVLTVAGVLYFVAMAVWWAPEPGARHSGARRRGFAPASTVEQEHV